jgi:hypothetical protein
VVSRFAHALNTAKGLLARCARYGGNGWCSHLVKRLNEAIGAGKGLKSLTLAARPLTYSPQDDGLAGQTDVKRDSEPDTFHEPDSGRARSPSGPREGKTDASARRPYRSCVHGPDARQRPWGLSMNLGPRRQPFTPSLSPSDGERVAAGRVRGWFMVPMRDQGSWRLPRRGIGTPAHCGLMPSRPFERAVPRRAESRAVVPPVSPKALVGRARTPLRAASTRRWPKRAGSAQVWRRAEDCAPNLPESERCGRESREALAGKGSL